MNVWVSISASACVCIQRYVCYKSSVLYSLHIRMNLWHGGVSTFIIYQFSFKSSVFAKDTCSIYQSMRHHSCRTTPWHHQLHWLPGHSKITDFCLLCQSPLILEILFGNWSGAWIWDNQCQMLHIVLQPLYTNTDTTFKFMVVF